MKWKRNGVLVRPSTISPSVDLKTMVGDALPLATPELRPKALTRACPDNDLDLFSIDEFTPEKRGSPKVSNASMNTARVQPWGWSQRSMPTNPRVHTSAGITRD